jgi:hypothetical protein
MLSLGLGLAGQGQLQLTLKENQSPGLLPLNPQCLWPLLESPVIPAPLLTMVPTKEGLSALSPHWATASLRPPHFHPDPNIPSLGAWSCFLEQQGSGSQV